MSIIINEDSLLNEEINERNQKVRAFLFDENNNVLVASYGSVLLLPGGSVDKDESIEDALVRELKEEIGADYSKDELSYLNTIDYYQRDYPKRDGSIKNRIVTTHYYTGMYKGVYKQTLTEKEKKGNFSLGLIPINDIKGMLSNHQSDNLRDHFFVRELQVISDYYLKGNKDKTLKKD